MSGEVGWACVSYPGKYIEINFKYENSISIHTTWITHIALRFPKLEWRWAQLQQATRSFVTHWILDHTYLSFLRDKLTTEYSPLAQKSSTSWGLVATLLLLSQSHEKQMWGPLYTHLPQFAFTWRLNPKSQEEWGYIPDPSTTTSKRKRMHSRG